MSRALFALGLLAALSACPGPIDVPDGGPDGGAWPDGAFTLGAEGADGGYLALPAELTGTPGAQGGFHVSVLYAVTGEAAAGVVFEHKVRRSSDNTLVSKGQRTFDVGPLSGWTPQGGIIIFMCPTPVGVNIIDEALRFEVTASQGGTLLGTASGTAIFRCPQGDSFCASVCKG